MTIAASTIIARAGILLQDTVNARWTISELVGWLNDGQRELVLLRPEACMQDTTMQLTAGQTHQTIPSPAIRLLDIPRNMGADGLTPGGAIQMIERIVLDTQVPTWHSQTGAAVNRYTFDSRNPKNFFVWPAPASTLYINVIYSVAPTDVTTDGTTVTGNLSMDDIYGNAILDYVLYRAYSKDAEYAGNAEKAVAYYSAFSNALGVRAKVDDQESPANNKAK